MSSLQDTNFRIRHADDRGVTELPWLKSSHSFSFGDYIDPDHMGFRNLRVINEDTVAPARGFPEHEHRSMEIFTYVVKGELLHEDNLGNSTVITSGQFQYMRAGYGVSHSEVNASETEPAHFLQIWLEPKELAGEPSYGMIDVGGSDDLDGLCVVASACGEDGALKIEQDAKIYTGHLTKGAELSMGIDVERPNIWIQMIEGSLNTHGAVIEAGDGFACRSCEHVHLKAIEDAHFLLFRLK